MKRDLITYTVDVDGDTYVVEDVPVRVDDTMGEPFFLLPIRSTGCRRSWSGRWRSGPSGVASPPRAEEIGDG